MLYIESTTLPMGMLSRYTLDMGGTAVVVNSDTGVRETKPISAIISYVAEGNQVAGVSDTMRYISITTITSLGVAYALKDSRSGWGTNHTVNPLVFGVVSRTQAKRFPVTFQDVTGKSVALVDMSNLENVKTVLAAMITPQDANSLRFKKESYLSNCYPTPISVGNIRFTCAEAAFQAMHFTDKDVIEGFIPLSGLGAITRTSRYSGRIRPDWDEVKIHIMRGILESKYMSDKTCFLALKNTGTKLLVYDSTGLHDNFWGDCQCSKCKGIEGSNMLGKMLMDLRNL